MLFSLITVTKDNRAGLRRTAESIKTQTCRDFEWIIIDGNSTDGTKDDLAAYDAAIVSEPDAGIYDAMNKGIGRASGDYLLFLNAGDSFAAPETLSLIAEETSARPVFIYGDSLERDTEAKLHYKPAKSHKDILHGMFTHHQAMLYARAALGQLRYDISYKIAGDYDLTLRFLQKHHNAAYLPIALCIFEGGGISQKQASLGLYEQYRTRKDVNIPLIKNALITTWQKIANNVRQNFPRLYWRIRNF